MRVNIDESKFVMFTSIVVFRYLDYISVMTYDYHGKSEKNEWESRERAHLNILGSWDNVTGINAPLYGRTFQGLTGFVTGWSVVKKKPRFFLC